MKTIWKPWLVFRCPQCGMRSNALICPRQHWRKKGRK